MGGPNRKSADVIKLYGGKPRDKAPIGRELPLAPPAELSRAERKVYGLVVGELTMMGYGSLADLSAIVRYCQATVLADVAHTHVTTRPMEYDRFDTLHLSPWFSVWERATAKQVTLGRELGLTPQSRNNLRLPSDSGSDDQTLLA